MARAVEEDPGRSVRGSQPHNRRPASTLSVHNIRLHVSVGRLYKNAGRPPSPLVDVRPMRARNVGELHRTSAKQSPTHPNGRPRSNPKRRDHLRRPRGNDPRQPLGKNGSLSPGRNTAKGCKTNSTNRQASKNSPGKQFGRQLLTRRPRIHTLRRRQREWLDRLTSAFCSAAALDRKTPANGARKMWPRSCGARGRADRLTALANRGKGAIDKGHVATPAIYAIRHM